MFLVFPNDGDRDRSVAACSLNGFLCWGGLPDGEIFLIERGKELAKRFRVVVDGVELVLLFEPFLLVGGSR